MRIIVAHEKPKVAEAIASKFTAYGCVPDIVDDPFDPKSFTHAFDRTDTTAFAVISRACRPVFNTAPSQKNGERPLTFQHDHPEELDRETLSKLFTSVATYHEHEENHVLKVAGLEIDLMAYDQTILNGVHKNMPVKKDNKTIWLRATEFKILRFLALNKNKTVSKADILAALNPDGNEPAEAGINVHMTKLRKKIEDDPANPKIIKTVRGKGYKCIDYATIQKPQYKSHGPLRFYDDETVTWNMNGQETIIKLTAQQRTILYHIANAHQKPLSAIALKQKVFCQTKKKASSIKSQIVRIKKAIANASADQYAPLGYNIIRSTDIGYTIQAPEPLPNKTYPISPLILRWSSANDEPLLEIDMAKRTATNLASNQTLPITPERFNALLRTIECPGWTQSSFENGSALAMSLNNFRERLKTIEIERPERFFESGKKGRNSIQTGYRLNPNGLEIIDPTGTYTINGISAYPTIPDVATLDTHVS